MTHYTTDNYPRLVWARRDFPFRIYARADGACAAIPVDPTSGHIACHYGNLSHVTHVKQANIRSFERACMDQSRQWLESCIADPPASWSKAHFAIARRVAGGR